ncbi:assimilatory sulfite reductase (NADPH) flavoprotein subunit [Alkalicoccus luteus]|uniref:assimilatory sulfite reductase (NADPH) n=1 Tax=Alkalicoccus luteus TaxID=1237094 RepID=A0A969PUE4_9BACI|nr:assimilatory sulfite reductase (NADPH) flavoprotein subunit [Alkalicoccus luteus]NJP38118.1 assimilatory sulfite reductase (NADPH) flavoprotein subunit [Alkalicoccus luteus]
MQVSAQNSPFTEKQAGLLNELLPELTEAQVQWLAGYTAAAGSGSAGTAVLERPARETKGQSRSLTILTASQTGNGAALAQEAAETFGVEASVLAAGDLKPKKFSSLEDVILIASTHGEGDPPDEALDLYDYLFSKKAPDLSHMRFAVLALGDSSYEYFCQTGKDFDGILEKLGAERVLERIDCDVDYEEPAATWLKQAEQQFADGEPVSPASEPAAPQEKAAYSKKHPYPAEIVTNFSLNGRGSAKETRHIELDLEASGLTYEPGDSLGILPVNDQALVEELLGVLDFNGQETVLSGKEEKTLAKALDQLEITVLTKPLLEKLAGYSDQLAALKEAERKAYMEGRDLVDLIQDKAPWTFTAQQLVDSLRPIPPRLYSIASSLSANPGEVHLTIGAVRYETHGRERNGVCSIQCAERGDPGSTLPVFIQSNKSFKLPADEKPIIMIGAGTGVAPYRSFMEEREEREAEGDNWLFFGDQHFTTDFLYQTEWQGWYKDGLLTRMDTAFSRDQDEKIYVQHRILEQSKSVFEWLERGAVLYVCGDKDRMAGDVHNALRTVIVQESGRSEEEAEGYLKELRSEKRYQRDVY